MVVELNRWVFGLHDHKRLYETRLWVDEHDGFGVLLTSCGRLCCRQRRWVLPTGKQHLLFTNLAVATF